MRYSLQLLSASLALAICSTAQAETPLTQSEYETAMRCIGTWEGAMNAIPVIYKDYPNKAYLDSALTNGAQLKRVNEAIFMATSQMRDSLDLAGGSREYSAGLMVVQSKKDNREAYVTAVEAHLRMPETCQSAIKLVGQKLSR